MGKALLSHRDPARTPRPGLLLEHFQPKRDRFDVGQCGKNYNLEQFW
ncbi:hypothetical protein OCK02_05855 [Rhizobium sp. TRM96647]|nr:MULTISPECIES: hypothetical protein [unclassified Rhizobium]MCV3735721.1 hypothetical protein [Rhizobium sp. TRM96647]MCV3758617.1 hypothetical protein [Rhizobium sp. TRM96650]